MASPPFIKALLSQCKTNPHALFCYLMVPQRGSPFIKPSLLHCKTYTFADRGLAPFSVEFVGFEQTLSKFVNYMRVFYIWAFALILFCCAGFWFDATNFRPDREKIMSGSRAQVQADSQMIPDDPRWPKWRRWSRIIQNRSRWSRMLPDDPRWS